MKIPMNGLVVTTTQYMSSKSSSNGAHYSAGRLLNNGTDQFNGRNNLNYSNGGSNLQCDHMHNASGKQAAEPIYSEPLPPMNNQVKEAEHRKNIKYFPDPNDPVQISSHIYEYLVKKTKTSSTDKLIYTRNQPPLPPLPNLKRLINR